MGIWEYALQRCPVTSLFFATFVRHYFASQPGAKRRICRVSVPVGLGVPLFRRGSEKVKNAGVGLGAVGFQRDFSGQACSRGWSGKT
jgi:hypothetical protein